MGGDFWRNRSVFVTGCTGFKGGWISLWLSVLGARVHGYSLEPPTLPSFFDETNLAARLSSLVIADILDLTSLKEKMELAKPSIVIHMAAQPLVLRSYQSPTETFATNVIGTVNLLEAVRETASVEAVINVTTDKCYENRESARPYRESDRLGGHDPYSSSKACAELAAAAYQKSFFLDAGIQLASVRAGNVIGGGDWAPDRLIPDFFRSIDADEVLSIRSPDAVRPWQHVLEPLAGYLTLAERLVADGSDFAQAWNFGPNETDVKPVSWVIDYLGQQAANERCNIKSAPQPHEAKLLYLNSAKARSELSWAPRWSIETALSMALDWHQAWRQHKPMDKFSIRQIEAYLSA